MQVPACRTMLLLVEEERLHHRIKHLRLCTAILSFASASAALTAVAAAAATVAATVAACVAAACVAAACCLLLLLLKLPHASFSLCCTHSLGHFCYAQLGVGGAAFILLFSAAELLHNECAPEVAGIPILTVFS